MTRRMLSEAEGYGLLKNHGIPVPLFSVVQSRQDVAVAAERTGYPLVMKVQPPGSVSIPDAHEITLLGALMRTIPDLVTQRLHADQGKPSAAEVTYTLAGIYDGRKIRLRYPVSDPALQRVLQ
ncbi:MAG: acetate--CoA ligase family protein, partial [Methanomicrobiales archaeon]|nr:acetate--CoA ligase family protein [Methanomicrobiales archaeon]